MVLHGQYCLHITRTFSGFRDELQQIRPVCAEGLRGIVQPPSETAPTGVGIEVARKVWVIEVLDVGIDGFDLSRLGHGRFRA